MEIDPHKQRELVFLSLYSLDSGQDGSSEDLADMITEECPANRAHVLNAIERARTVMDARALCDAWITRVCQEYTVDRIQSVERNILRLAIFELVVEKTLPPKIVFSEARRLTKKFSTGGATTFVMGLLDAVAASAAIAVGDPEPQGSS